MNITQHSPNLSISTITNQATQSLQRENIQRDLITQPAAVSQSLAEKGVAADLPARKEPSSKKSASSKKDSVASKEDLHEERKHHEAIEGFEEQKISDQSPSEKFSNERKAQSAELESQREKQNELEQQVIKELEQKDAEIKEHERAHQLLGGGNTDLPHYNYTTGPDGKRYVTGGAVPVDLSIKEGDPSATISKMVRVKSTALEPNQPSMHDLRVAFSASNIALQAHAELVLAATDHIDGPIQQKLAPQQNTDVMYNLDGIDNLLDEMAMSDIRDSEMEQRSQRIASHYQAITTAYDTKPEKMVEVSV
ncbi:MAG: putative metalloprotease CJM1_0395 family protein [Colwellia sp.]